MTPETYNPFRDMISLMDEEDLIRWKKRCDMASKRALSILFAEEIATRKIEVAARRITFT